MAGVASPLCSWDERCSDNHLRKISEIIANWRAVAPYLDLTAAEEQDIIGYPPLPIPRQRTEMLNTWKRKNGKGATYRKLAKIFGECKRQDIVDMIEELVTAETGSNTATPELIPAVSSASSRDRSVVVQDCRPLNFSKAVMEFPDPAAFWGLDDEPACKYTGEGFTLLVFDTGIATKLRCFATREVGKTLLFMNPDVPCDDNDGHGSFCARISCGDQFEDAYNRKALKCRGVAPGATLAIWKGYEHGKEGVNEERTSKWSSQLNQMVDEVGSSVDVVVISSCSEVYNEDAEKAIQTLKTKKVIVVCAAGNHGKKDKVNIRFPASLDGVICVGAHDQNGYQCSFSSHDVSTQKCDVLALGDDVIGLKLDGLLTKRSGTSIAAPAVGGLICLILQAIKKRCGEIDCAAIKNNRAMKLLLQELITSSDVPVISRMELRNFFRDPKHYVDNLKSNGLI